MFRNSDAVCRKRNAEVAFGDEIVFQQRKRQRIGAPQASMTPIPALRTRKRARESVDEIDLRRSKRLKGESPSPTGPLPGRASRKPQANKGKPKRVNPISLTQAVNGSPLGRVAEAPEKQKTLLRINTSVTQPWTLSSRHPVLLTQRRGISPLSVDTNLAASSAVPKQRRRATPYVDKHLEKPSSSPLTPPPTSPPQPSPPSPSLIRTVTPLNHISSSFQNREESHSSEDTGYHADNEEDYEEPRWPENIPSFAYPIETAKPLPNQAAREAALRRREQRMYEHEHYLPPPNATLSARERSLYEAVIHRQEALFAACHGYIPPPTDLFIGDRAHLLKSFVHDQLVERARSRTDVDPLSRARVLKNLVGLGWRERWRIIVEGEITREQRMYVACFPGQFCMRERDVAVESVQESLRQGEVVSEVEKGLRHGSGYRGGLRVGGGD